MSFLYDPNLLKHFAELIEPKKKMAQQAAPTTPAPDAIKNLALKLINNLDKSSGITTENPESSALFMRDLQNLDQLIAFLNIEMVKYNGMMIIQPNYNAPDIDKSLYLPYKWAGGVEGFPVNSVVAVYKDGLIAYLKSLQANAQQMGGTQGQLLTTLINKLVDQANTTLKAGIKPEDMQTPSDEAAQPVLLDNTPLDSINLTLEVENPMAPPRDKGELTLTPKDFKSKMSFDDLARKLKVSKAGKVSDYDANSPTFFCDILQVLHSRASSYAYRRGVYLDKTYLQMIEAMANQYTCNITTISGSGGNATKPTSYMPASSQTLTPAGQKAAATLSEQAPLLGDRIDLPRIRNWLNVYHQLANNVNAEATTIENIATAQNMLETIVNNYHIVRQPLAQNANEVASTILRSKNGAALNAPIGYLNQLRDLINMIGNILTDFKGNIYDSVPQLRSELDEQIGEGASSFYNINIDKINGWLEDMPSVLQALRH